MTPLTPFYDFKDQWLRLSLFLSKRDLHSFGCTSRFINASVTQAFEGVFFSFLTKPFKEQEQDLEFFFKEMIPKLGVLSPESPILYLSLGEVYRIQGLNKKAKAEFEKLTLDKIHPKSNLQAFVMTAQAIVAFWKSDVTRAENLLEESFKINPNYTPTLLYRFTILQEHRKEEAVACLQTIFTNDPDNLHAKLRYAKALFYGIGVKKDEEKAKQNLTDMIATTQSTCSLHLTGLLADFYRFQNDLDYAQVLLQSIIENKDLDDAMMYHKVHMKLAEICLSGSVVQARETFELLEKASSTDNLSDLYIVAKLFIHESLGPLVNVEKAIELCNRILKVKPDDVDAKQLLSTLHRPHKNSPMIEFTKLYDLYKMDENDRKTQEALIKLLTTELESPKLLAELLERYDPVYDKTSQTSEELFQDLSQIINKVPTIRASDQQNFLNEIEQQLLNAPDSPSVAIRAVEALLRKKVARFDLYEMLDAHLERLIKLYPLNTSLLLRLGIIKSRIPNYDPKVLWDIYTKVLSITSNQNTDEAREHRSEALIVRANLFITCDLTDLPDYDYSIMRSDLLEAYEYCTSPELLISSAVIFEKNAILFEDSFVSALKMALKAYLITLITGQKGGEEIQGLIGELYKQGGHGIIQSQKIANLWHGGCDEDMTAEDCLTIAKSLLEVDIHEAAFYLTLVFMKSQKPEAIKPLISASLLATSPGSSEAFN